jgi:hypothetical protein
MLVLFVISVTPKQLLHNVITGHKHSYAKLEADINFQASKNNFQCNWHDQLIESPFIDQPDFELPQPFIHHASYTNHYTLSYYSASLFLSSLRGPPTQL